MAADCYQRKVGMIVFQWTGRHFPERKHFPKCLDARDGLTTVKLSSASRCWATTPLLALTVISPEDRHHHLACILVKHADTGQCWAAHRSIFERAHKHWKRGVVLASCYCLGLSFMLPMKRKCDLRHCLWLSQLQGVWGRMMRRNIWRLRVWRRQCCIARVCRQKNSTT